MWRGLLLASVALLAHGGGGFVWAKSSAHPMASSEAAARPGRQLQATPPGFRKGKEREIQTLGVRDPHAIMQAKAFVKETNLKMQEFSSASLGLKAMLYALSEKDIVLLDEEVQNGFLTEMVESQDQGTTYAMVILTEMRNMDRIYENLEFPVWEVRNVTTWQSNDLSFRKTLHSHVPPRKTLQLADPTLKPDIQASIAAVNKEILHSEQHPDELRAQITLGRVEMASRQTLEMNFRNLFQEYEDVSGTPTYISVTYVLFTTVPQGSVHKDVNTRQWLAAVYRESTGHVSVIALKESQKSQRTQCNAYAQEWGPGCDGPNSGRKRSKSRLHMGAGAGGTWALVESILKLGAFLCLVGAVVYALAKNGHANKIIECFKSSPGLELLNKRRAGGSTGGGAGGYQAAQTASGEFGNDDL